MFKHIIALAVFTSLVNCDEVMEPLASAPAVEAAKAVERETPPAAEAVESETPPEEHVRIQCNLIGGTYVPGKAVDDACIDRPKTEEECTKKGGKYGQWCLENSKCVSSPDHCYFELPKDLSPQASKYFDDLFQKVLEFEQNQAAVPMDKRRRRRRRRRRI